MSESSHNEDQTSDGGSPTNSETVSLPDVQEELLAAQDKHLRLAAEFENYKRRSQRDVNESIKFANESLLKNLLPVIDNLERAIQCGKDVGMANAVMEGVELTHKSFLETVEKLGVRQISSAGQPFDPSRHQAVAQVESDTLDANIVVEEFQKGYFLHDRILRPAMVTVSKEPSNKTTQ
ncbi:MAG: nucleotide exchange factor GrpE [Nitrospirales bacterium]|nr:nucleotide exchange factor GrpE [Nitrospirales bacterium]